MAEPDADPGAASRPGDSEEIEYSAPARVRQAIVLAVALVCLITGAGITAWLTRNGPEEFPLQRPGIGFTSAELVPGDARFSFGSLYLLDPGADVQILKVEPRMSSNVEYLGAYVRWPGKLYGSTGGPFYPNPREPKRYRHSLNEVIPASVFRAESTRIGRPSRAGITAGFRVVSGDVGAVNGILVTYRVGNQTKRQYFSQSVVGCIKPNPCRDPDDPRADYEQIVLRRFGLLPD